MKLFYYLFLIGSVTSNDNIIFFNGFQQLPEVLKINDTGANFTGLYPVGNLTSCDTNGTPQDCFYGRDVTHNDDSDGHAGFSYTKLDINGNPLDVSAISWACVQDNVTGYVWEVKTDDDGIHDKDNTYRWGGLTAIGRDHPGRLGPEHYYDDWNVLVEGSNLSNFCGFNDWRVPTLVELGSITNYKTNLDTNFFPHYNSLIFETYWSASPIVDTNGVGAWIVWFWPESEDSIVLDYYMERFTYNKVRLVRSGD